MTANQVFQWPDGVGWIVLSGGREVASDVRAQALSRARSHGGVAYIGLDVDDDEDILEDMAELGAPTGYLVNIMTEDDETIRARLAEAAVIVIPGDFDLPTLRSALLGAGVAGLLAAFEGGALILAEGQAAALFGAAVEFQDGSVAEGFNWVEDSLILPGVRSVSQSALARDYLGSRRVRIAVGIGDGSALALGPTGEVETWGQRQVTIALGQV